MQRSTMYKSKSNNWSGWLRWERAQL